VKTIRKIQQTFGDEALSISRMREWFSGLKDGRTSVDSEPRPSRPSSRNVSVIDQVRTLVMQDRRITVRELAVEVDSILAEDLGLKRASTNLSAVSQQCTRPFLASDPDVPRI
jgi:hypothetical protein